MTEQERESAKQAWLDGLPPAVRVVVDRLGVDCVRDGRGGHYVVQSYQTRSADCPTHAGGPPVTVTIAHGADSFLPGFGVFGIDPADLVPCGCGKWRAPTESQKRFAAARVRAMRAETAEGA